MAAEYIIGRNVKIFDRRGELLGTAKEITDRNGRIMKRYLRDRMRKKNAEVIRREAGLDGHDAM